MQVASNRGNEGPDTPGIEPANYAYYNAQPYIHIRAGVSLVYGIRPTETNWKWLREFDRPRYDRFKQDVVVASKWVNHDPLLQPVLGTNDVPMNRSKRSRTRVYTAHFVAWVRERKLLQAEPSKGFLELDPAIPEGTAPPSALLAGNQPEATDAETPLVGRSTRTGDLALAFLLLYLQRLSALGHAPPKALFLAEGKRLNAQALAKDLSALTEFRCDLKTEEASRSSGASTVTLGKRLREALDLVDSGRLVASIKALK